MTNDKLAEDRALRSQQASALHWEFATGRVYTKRAPLQFENSSIELIWITQQMLVCMCAPSHKSNRAKSNRAHLQNQEYADSLAKDLAKKEEKEKIRLEAERKEHRKQTIQLYREKIQGTVLPRGGGVA